MNRLRPLLAFASLIAFAAAPGCGDAVVGAECIDGYVACDGRCIDLLADVEHCGGCELRCDSEQQCVAGTCEQVGDQGMMPIDLGGDMEVTFGVDMSFPSDQGVSTDAGDMADLGVESDIGAAPDMGGTLDMGSGSLDMGSGSLDMGSGSLDMGSGSFDMGSGALDMGSGSLDMGSGCACGVGDFCCADGCFDLDVDPNHCGDCDTRCGAGEVCAAGTCSPLCTPPLTFCAASQLCIDTETDPDNCGVCGTSCSAGICEDSACVLSPVGHVVLIGHSYQAAVPVQQQVIANAIDLPTDAQVEVLSYIGDASAGAVAGTRAAIHARLGATMWNETVAADPSEVPALLADADVFMVYSQTHATDSALLQLGADWAVALAEFSASGIIVVLDGGGTHGGTWQVLSAAGLLDITDRAALATPASIVDVASAGDALALGLPSQYSPRDDAVSFSLAGAGTVVVESREVPPRAVVIHRVFTQ